MKTIKFLYNLPEWQIMRAWTPPLPSSNFSISRACCRQKIRGRANVQLVFQLIVPSELSAVCASLSYLPVCSLTSRPRLFSGILFSDFSLSLHEWRVFSLLQECEISLCCSTGPLGSFSLKRTSLCEFTFWWLMLACPKGVARHCCSAGQEGLLGTNEHPDTYAKACVKVP